MALSCSQHLVHIGYATAVAYQPLWPLHVRHRAAGAEKTQWKSAIFSQMCQIWYCCDNEQENTFRGVPDLLLDDLVKVVGLGGVLRCPNGLNIHPERGGDVDFEKRYDLVENRMFLTYSHCARFTVLFWAPLELWPLKKRSWMDVSVSVDRGGACWLGCTITHTEKRTIVRKTMCETPWLNS